MKTHIYYAVKEIRRRILRTAANISGYTVAVAFMITLISLSQTSTLASTSVLQGVGTHFMAFVPASMRCPCQFLEVGPFIKGVYTETFNLSTINRIKNLSGVKDAAPYFMFKLGNRTIGGIDVNRLATKTTAVSPEEVVEGRYLQSEDEGAVLLDEVYADIMGIQVNNTIEAFKHNFTVVGIVNPGVHSRPAGEAHMYAPIKMVRKIVKSYSGLNYLIGGDANAVLVEAAHGGQAEKIEEVKKSVIDTLESQVGKKASLAGYGCYVPARNVISITEETAWILSMVILSSVVLLSLRSQWGSIIERRSEIGILKAIGWANSDIIKQIVIESLIQGSAGGLIGCCLGYMIPFLLPLLGLFSSQNISVVVPLSSVLTGFIASLTGGIVAGVLPAWQATRLQPAEALRRP